MKSPNPGYCLTRVPKRINYINLAIEKAAQQKYGYLSKSKNIEHNLT
jgi:hypothetical protein